MHRDNIVRIKEATDCRSIFKRFWPNHFRERGNCFCPFHDDSKSSLQVSRELAFCHAENLKLDAVDLYARATGTTNGVAVAQLAKELGLRQSGGPRIRSGAGPGVPAAGAQGLSGNSGRRPRSPGRRMVAVYDYTDAEGKLLYQTVKYEPKTFRQRRPGGGATAISYSPPRAAGNPGGGSTAFSCLPASRVGGRAVNIRVGGPGSQAWIWNLDGVRRVPYRFSEVIAADTVFVVEGEKDADRPARLFAEGDLACGPSSPGARLVTASEGERGQRLAESLIKRLTGGDKISARFLHQEFFEFVPEFKIVLSTNHKPSIRGTDAAIWSRIHLVPFDVTIPKSEQIPRTLMLERLKKEWPGILAWAAEGCLAWQKEGLEKPEEVERATSDYRADSDILGGFISDCCIINPLAKCRSTDLYVQYQKWCGDNGEEYFKFRTFGAVLEERGLRRTRLGHKQDRGFQGIGLKACPSRDTG